MERRNEPERRKSRQGVSAKERQVVSAKRWVTAVRRSYPHPEDIPRDAVYNQLKSVTIEGTPTSETRRQADLLFEKKIKKTAVFKTSKLVEKGAYWQNLVHALKRAIYHEGCVRYPRNKNHPDFSKARLQVIEAAIEADLAGRRNTFVVSRR